MQRALFMAALTAFGVLWFLPAVLAGQPSADEQAFLDKHMSDVVVIAPVRMDDPSVLAAIAAPIYQLTITLNSGDGGTMTQTQMAARVGDKLVPLSRPGTDGNCPDLQKMIRPGFHLKADDDARALQSALNALFPPVVEEEKKAIAFRHQGHDWQFVRGVFFGKPMGFVFTTDDQGNVTAVKFALKLS